MIILDYYHNFTNLDLFNVLFLTLGITGLSLFFSGWNYFQNRKNIDFKENLKNIFNVIPLQILLTFICLSFILYSSAKIYLNLDINLNFTELNSIQETSSDFWNLISNIVTYLVTSFILPFTEEPLKDYAGLCFVTITFGLASLWYLLTTLSKDEKRRTSIIKFCCYFGVIGFLWFYQDFDPLQEKLDYIIRVHQVFVEEIRNERIDFYANKIQQTQSICNFLLIIINFLFISVFDDWLIINGYRILTKGVTSRFHRLKIRIIDYIMALSAFMILLISGNEVAFDSPYLSNLANDSFPSFLINYGELASSIGMIFVPSIAFVGIFYILLYFLFIILSPFFLLNRLLDTIISLFKNNSSEVTTETEES